jgi:glucokinase
MSATGSLLADIGGTNARFAIMDSAGEVREVKIYQVRENPTLISALRDYKKNHCRNYAIGAVAIAVAGPVLSDVVTLTNSDWVCDKKEIASEFGTDSVFILNDFEAVAFAISDLKPEEITVIQAGKPSTRHPKIVMGPGTGLGVAALKPTAGGFEAITTEAGHTRYAPANERERKLIGYLSRSLNFVRAEDLISGPGLVNIYEANCQLVGEEFKPCDPADVVAQARGGNPLFRQVLDDFAAIFGSFASQIALSYNALGGIYLTGGVLQKMGSDFNQDRFLERFATNPRMADLLGRMPVIRVLADIPAFAGLSVVLKKAMQTQK